MEGKVWGYCSSEEDIDDNNTDLHFQNASDDDQNNYFSSHSFPKFQPRIAKSKGMWKDEIGMAEIIEKNGKMWITTGICRSHKTYSSIEETV
ncbi:hypothetical protein Lal_00023329 [Lupinus albus]|nr:hypothetical protein Lal_00023329 [Lupinus albus]